MTDSSDTIDERLRSGGDALTRAERQLADIILENYPVSGLGSITQLAAAANVSTPTVARMVQKLGFRGFPEFQSALRNEIEAKISDPITKRDSWAGQLPEGHLLNRFTEAVVGNIGQTLAQIDIEAFDTCCDLLAETERPVFVLGGRITRALADYLFLHMQVLRPHVHHVHTASNAWPHYLLDLGEGDMMVIFDVRRYENAILRLAEIAAERGARIVLFTDQWRSPVSRHAEFCFPARIAVPSAWDSNIALMLLAETMLAEVQERIWPETKARMEALEGMFDRTGFFRKFT